MADFVMPSLGADMDAGTLVAWKKEVGEHVARGEIVAEVETDKGVIAIEAFRDGVLEQKLVAVGAKVPVGTTLAVFADAEAEPDEAAPPIGSETPPGPTPTVAPTPPAPPPEAPLSTAANPTVEPRGSTPERTSASTGPDALATISARALSQEHGIDPGSLVGSGPHGVVTRADVLRALEAPRRPRITPYARRRARELGLAATDIEPPAGRSVVVHADVELAAKTRGPQPESEAHDDHRESLTPEQRMRRAIGAAMARSKREIPHYYVATTIDLEPALARLAQHNAEVPVAERVLPAVLLLRAATIALKKVPELNALCVGETAPAVPQVDLGVAVALRKGGLVAPPIVDAGRLGVVETMRALEDLVQRARLGRLSASDLRGGTITVTSLGDRGVESLYPIVFPPQVAIVGFGKIVTRPWVVGNAVVPRTVVTATLGADHRFSDGHRGGLYLAAIEAALASPDAIFARGAGG